MLARRRFHSLPLPFVVSSLLLLVGSTMTTQVTAAASHNCKGLTVDFIIKENDPEVAAVEDDIVQDLAKIGITVNTIALNSSAYIDAELKGNYNMLFTRTWGAPYDPHSYMFSWAVPAHVEYSAIGGMEPPLTRESLLKMVSDVTVETDAIKIGEKWEAIHQAVHDQAIFLPLWGTRIPYVLNRRFGYGLLHVHIYAPVEVISQPPSFVCFVSSRNHQCLTECITTHAYLHRINFFFTLIVDYAFKNTSTRN